MSFLDKDFFNHETVFSPEFLSTVSVRKLVQQIYIFLYFEIH